VKSTLVSRVTGVENRLFPDFATSARFAPISIFVKNVKQIEYILSTP